MSETNPNIIKPKKMVSRNVAIALGIICILLIAVITYFSITGISAQNSYNNLQKQNKQLQTWLDGNETLLNQTQANNTNLTNQVNDLTSTLNLEKSTVWVSNQTISQPANSYTDMSILDMGFLVTYAGYVLVNVTSSTSNTTYVEVMYSAYGINYDNTITVGTNGTATFPVLSMWSTFALYNVTAFSTSSSNRAFQVIIVPFENIEIKVGNTNTVGNATETVTITYYY
jgi:cell division protein FtsB